MSASSTPIDRAVESFVADNYDRLLRLAWLICRNGPDAADAVQRGLEQAWRQRATLREETRLRPWVDRVVVREAIRMGRRPLLRRVLSLDSQVGWLEPGGGPDPGLREWSGLRAAFGRLPADQRAVIALHLHAGYSVAETASIVDAPIETVRTRIRRAKDRLRSELGEEQR
ncbi:MAG TPA: RNA polymerase sigma factor [Candidatus Limnocylindria bacterium]|nr:RNA polymerase sigma factor [Candidatus Limnocylindria bacterium]